MKVKELVEYLQAFDPEIEVFFGGTEDALQFHRLKDRGGILQFEFNQNIYRDKKGKLYVDDYQPEQN